jgi:uncharacterized protein YecE (DUF72 family)
VAVTAGDGTHLMPVHVGCSGWNYRDWKEAVYAGAPAREWLELYARIFDTVEVNNTFYRLPSPTAVEGWAERSPPGFLLAVKVSRYLTHVKRLRDVGPGIQRFRGLLDPLSEARKLGPLLWQFPETFHRDDERLAGALEVLNHGDRHAFEFRHASWFVPEVYELLREAGAALVIGDHPERPFQSYEMTTDWTFVRMHWGRRGRRGNYSKRELETWRQRIAGWRGEVEVFAYFNNDWEAFAPANATWLKEQLT